MRSFTGAKLALIALLLSGCFGRHVHVVHLPPAEFGARGQVPRGYGIIHASPRYTDRQRNGVIVRRIRRRSLAREMGLVPGDIIVKMDGIPCNELRACRRGARRLERALRQGRPFSIVLERGSRLVEFRYRYRNYAPISL